MRGDEWGREGNNGLPQTSMDLRGTNSKWRGAKEKGREGKKREEVRDPQWRRVHGARGRTPIYFQRQTIFCLNAFCTGFGVGYLTLPPFLNASG